MWQFDDLLGEESQKRFMFLLLGMLQFGGPWDCYEVFGFGTMMVLGPYKL